MHPVHIGVSGWAYAAWKPGFYPAKTPSAKFLAYYATQMNTVEVNYTFRTLPAAKTLAGWIDATPADFIFAVKANQRITHIKRLKDIASDLAAFYNAIAPLRDAGRLGPVLFQLPPFVKADAPLLRDFLAQLPAGYRHAIEFRHDSWFNDHTYAAMRDRDVALCIAESDGLKVPEVQTATFAYFRFRQSDYGAAELKRLEEIVGRTAAEREVFAFMKHEEDPQCALNAVALLRALQSA